VIANVPPFEKAGLGTHLRQRAYFGMGNSIEVGIVIVIHVDTEQLPNAFSLKSMMLINTCLMLAIRQIPRNNPDRG
jgi:hypothetical protein